MVANKFCGWLVKGMAPKEGEKMRRVDSNVSSLKCSCRSWPKRRDHGELGTTKNGYCRTEFAILNGRITIPVSGICWLLKSTSRKEKLEMTGRPLIREAEIREALAPLSRVAVIGWSLMYVVIVTGPLVVID